MSDVVVRVEELTKVYRLGEVEVHALAGVTTEIRAGEFVAVMGASGSGKSTFMNMLGCLDRPTAGTYELEGRDVSALTRDELAHLRNTRLGFVFQGFNLLPRMTAAQNVELPLIYGDVPPAERRRRALEALEEVGLGGRADHLPGQLSGGQQQRVAIARALVNHPALLLADEPTGNLDSRTSLDIMRLVTALHARGATIVMVTHEPDIAAFATRQLMFRDGCIVQDRPNVPVRAEAPVARVSP